MGIFCRSQRADSEYLHFFISSLRSGNVGTYRLLPCITENPRHFPNGKLECRKYTNQFAEIYKMVPKLSKYDHLLKCRFFGVKKSRGKNRNGKLM
jgi:hypothetical protein